MCVCVYSMVKFFVHGKQGNLFQAYARQFLLLSVCSTRVVGEDHARLPGSLESSDFVGIGIDDSHRISVSIVGTSPL